MSVCISVDAVIEMLLGYRQRSIQVKLTLATLHHAVGSECRFARFRGISANAKLALGVQIDAQGEESGQNKHDERFCTVLISLGACYCHCPVLRSRLQLQNRAVPWNADEGMYDGGDCYCYYCVLHSRLRVQVCAFSWYADADHLVVKGVSGRIR